MFHITNLEWNNQNKTIFRSFEFLSDYQIAPKFGDKDCLVPTGIGGMILKQCSMSFVYYIFTLWFVISSSVFDLSINTSYSHISPDPKNKIKSFLKFTEKKAFFII